MFNTPNTIKEVMENRRDQAETSVAMWLTGILHQELCYIYMKASIKTAYKRASSVHILQQMQSRFQDTNKLKVKG